MRILLRLFVGIALFNPSLAAAAQAVDAQLSGVVRDNAGNGVAAAAITVANGEGLVRTAGTDASGRYRVLPLPPGIYTVTVQKAGFRTEARRDIAFAVGAMLAIDFVLDVAAAQSVEVTGTRPLLETTSNALSRLVTRDEIDVLPVVDRNFNALATLAPDVTPTGTYGGVDIGGSRDFQNGYNVDGVSAEGLGAGEQRITYAQDWIQEFQVLGSQFAAEFGRASGGVLNAVTRSGSNVTRGRLYGFFRDEAWDAIPAFATEKTPIFSARIGGTASGRLLADGLFAFVGAEWFDNSVTRVVNASFPAYNGSVSAEADQKLLFAKVDRHANGSNAYRFRYNTDRRRSTNEGVGGRNTEQYGRGLRYNATDVVGSWTEMLSSSAFNELRGAFTATSSRTTCNYAESNPDTRWLTLQYPTTFLGCTGDGFGDKSTDEMQVIDNVSLARGPHDLKFGAHLSRPHSEGDFRFLRDGIYRFQRDLPFTLANPLTYPVFFARFQGPTEWNYRWLSWGAFVQDSWRVAEDLTINAGVRYDIDGAYTALNRLLRTRPGLTTVSLDRNNVAPRVGAAWAPFAGATTIIRGGFGTYYDDHHANIATLLLLNGVLVERATFIQANDPGLNPYGTDVGRAQRLLAEALAQGAVPDLAFSGIPDLERDLQVPFTAQGSVGAAHQFQNGLHVSADVVIARGYDQFVIRDVNIERDAALLQGRIVRPDPSLTFINRYGNDGLFRHRALQMQARYVPAAGHMVAGAYTLATTRSNTRTALEGSGGGPAAATNPFNYDEDYGPADHDVRHSVALDGHTRLPFDTLLSAVLNARSALPYSATTTQQLDTDPFLDRPEPRNSRRGDRFLTLDARLAKTIRVGRRLTGTAFVEVFNLTNQTNLTQYTGSITSTRFGQPTSAFERRRTQLGFRVDF